ncbi:hypothetical protein [Acidithiobacillus thiooxidans]|uniref:hypothetical protein n=1 Tax=Acidithiobacillus thiooxidans TaxID=930 RepID=UPI001C067F87|nr:hypothetical protein [Acidithiobacillus thiooxidans]MBU2843205.1 hypothetical protein [Acidithiobacillus thiooxidans]
MLADTPKGGIFYFSVALVAIIGLITAAIWQYVSHTVNHHWQQELIQDTHHTITIQGSLRHDGIAIVRLKTPRGPEIAYLVDHGKYLAIGPLMDLKNGKNVTPIWERKYVS